MDEIELYRAKIEKRYQQRRRKGRFGGRRIEDYKPPRFWTWGFVVQLVTLIVGGLCMLILGGCAYIKKTMTGG